MARKKNDIGTRISELLELRAKIKKQDDIVTELKKKRKVLEEELIAVLDSTGTTLASSGKGTASISETLTGSIKDRAAAEQWMRRTNNLHLLQNRISSPAFKELLDNRRGKAIPGIESFKVRKLNLRAK